jgi:hypothetical protein
MLFRQHVLDRIATGEITLAFRRWQRPTVKPGGRLRTAAGELAILHVDSIGESDITEPAARRAGYASPHALLEDLCNGREGTLYRIEFRLAGPDTRITLREQSDLTDDEFADIALRLKRWDAASSVGPWTRRVLELIGTHPAVRAGDLADLGGFEKEWLKVRVRKLKNLGLTESLHPGYRLSPRGASVYQRLAQSSSAGRP